MSNIIHCVQSCVLSFQQPEEAPQNRFHDCTNYAAIAGILIFSGLNDLYSLASYEMSVVRTRMRKWSLLGNTFLTITALFKITIGIIALYDALAFQPDLKWNIQLPNNCRQFCTNLATSLASNSTVVPILQCNQGCMNDLANPYYEPNTGLRDEPRIPYQLWCMFVIIHSLALGAIFAFRTIRDLNRKTSLITLQPRSIRWLKPMFLEGVLQLVCGIWIVNLNKLGTFHWPAVWAASKTCTNLCVQFIIKDSGAVRAYDQSK